MITIQRLNSPELVANNEAFHRLLTEGIKVTFQKDGHSRGDLVWLVDFKDPENNDFLVANQFTVTSTGSVTATSTGSVTTKRPDVVLFVNGLPLVVIELKNPADENATVKSAFRQLQTYKQTIPGLFIYNGIIVGSDGLEARAGSISAGFSRFMAWKTSDGKVEASPLVGQLETGVIKVVMTSASSDDPEIAKHHTTKEQRRSLAERMKDPEDELRLVIVRDMWLTGFDVPSMHTLYIDKPMKGHNLMQAIARVNRVYKDKPGGLVVDYLGIASDLKKALSFYSDSGGKGDPAIAQEKAVQMMLEKLEVVSQMFHDFAYEDYFEADTRTKLFLILAAEEHILGLENGKKRYINEVTSLSQAFAIAIPHEQAMDAKDEVAFFQAVKSRLAKFDATGTGRTNEEIETAIRQVIDKALVSEQVIDVFDAAGIKKPDISILSEEFLLEVKNMKHKNIALEVLKKLLHDEIKTRTKKNLIQGKSLMEMLEISIKRYHNKIISAAEVIEELIALGKDIREMDKEPHEMGLSEFEYAFYTAIANNDSARDVMGKDKLRELAIVLYEKVKENTSIDWTIKESVKAKLKVIVKRTLRQYGYPPDMQKLATETVLKQAEMIAEEITRCK